MWSRIAPGELLMTLIVRPCFRHLGLQSDFFHQKGLRVSKCRTCCFYKKGNEPTHNKTYNKACVTSKESDHSVHPHSMIRVLVYPSLVIPEAIEGTCDQQRLWSESSLVGQVVLQVLSFAGSKFNMEIQMLELIKALLKSSRNRFVYLQSWFVKGSLSIVLTGFARPSFAKKKKKKKKKKKTCWRAYNLLSWLKCLIKFKVR